MPSQNPIPVKPSQLRAAFKTDLAACWNLSRKLYPDHHPYAFGLYGLEGGAHFMPYVLTEEGLTQVAERYIKKGIYETLAESRKALRYSVADSPQLARFEDKLTTVDALLKPHEKLLCQEETAAYEQLAKAAMDALKELDNEGLFGNGKPRERLLLIIITEDTEDDWSKPSAKRLNPPAVFKRFEADTKVEGVFMSSQAIALSSDERSLYSVGSRKPDPEKRGSVSEIVAYDVTDLRLKRRWDFSFPLFGDSARAISCSRDGKTILVMRCKYVDKVAQTLLMRFGCEKNTVIEQAQVQGECACFAVSKNSSRIAVVMHNKTLHIFDSKLRVLQVIALPAKALHLEFLGSGDLLVPTAAGIFRIDRDFKLTTTPCKDDCAWLSVDDAESLAVIGMGYDWMGFARNKDSQVEIGCKLIRLPSFETLKELKFPELIVKQPVISPDGRYIAFNATKIKTHFNFNVVCETETGREIVRQKAGSTNDLKFLRDNRTVALAVSALTTTEPIVFWRVPGL